MPEPSLSRLTGTTGFKEVRPVIQALEGAIYADARSPVVSLPVYSGYAEAGSGFSIDCVLTFGDRSEVFNPVVARNTIDVVNYLWRFLVVKELPSNSMSKVIRSINPYSQMTARVSIYSRLFRSGVSYISRFCVVLKDSVNGLWDNFCSHFKLPLDLVRGVGTAIPTTPIIQVIGVSNGIRT